MNSGKCCRTSYSEIISKMQYYVKKISGTNSYWYQTKEQLRAALNQFASYSWVSKT